MKQDTKSTNRRDEKLDWPILKKHEHPRILDTGMPGAARSTIIPTPGLEEISGVPDHQATGAIGKLMVCSLYPTPNKNFMKTLQLLGRMRDLPRNARIYLEHTGKGYPFYRVKYRHIDPTTGRSKVESIYLGRPDRPVLRWMEAIMLEDRLRPGSRSFLDTRKPCDLEDATPSQDAE